MTERPWIQIVRAHRKAWDRLHLAIWNAQQPWYVKHCAACRRASRLEWEKSRG